MDDRLIALWFRMREPQHAQHVRDWVVYALARRIMFRDEIGC